MASVGRARNSEARSGSGWVKRWRVTPAVVATLTLSLVLLAGCGSSGTASGLAKYKSSGVTVGMIELAPLTYSQNGTWTGESVVLVDTILRKLGITKIHNVVVGSIAGLIPSLQAGRTDIVDDLVIKAARCQVINFSAPYLTTYPAFGYIKGHLDGLHSWGDVKAKDATVGILAGSVDAEAAASAGVATSQIDQYPDLASGLTALEDGRIQAMSSDQISLSTAIRSAHLKNVGVVPEEHYVIAGVASGNYTGAFGFRKNETALFNAFNKELEKMIPKETAQIGARFDVPAGGYQAATKYTTRGLCS